MPSPAATMPILTRAGGEQTATGSFPWLFGDLPVHFGLGLYHSLTTGERIATPPLQLGEFLSGLRQLSHREHFIQQVGRYPFALFCGSRIDQLL